MPTRSLSVAIAGSQAQTPAAKAVNAPRYGTFGFDAAGMNRSVAPGASFYNFANGTWDRTTEIPGDKSNYGMFTVLADLSESRTRGILDEARQRRIKLVVLEVRPSNTEARTLYESFGFRVVGRRRGYYYDTGEDALVMEADLQTAHSGTRA